MTLNAKSKNAITAGSLITAVAVVLECVLSNQIP